MEGWFKVGGIAVAATAGVLLAIYAYYESERQQNEGEYTYGNPSSERTNNDEFHAIYNQRQRSQDSTMEAKLREAALKRAEKLAKLREERKRQLEKEEKKRKKEEDERKRKREEEEKERKKNEKMKSMLDSFDDVFDDEMGVKTDRVHVDENIDDWSRNAEKQKLKQEFRAKQMAQQQKSQDEKDKRNSNNRTDDLKMEQQKSGITKCFIDKQFKIQEFILNAIIRVNVENNFTLALSLRSIKKNKKKKIVDLQELESAVLSLQKILQANESPKISALSKNAKKKLKRKKAEEITQAAEKKQEDKLETVESYKNCRSTFVQKQLEDQKKKLELEKKKREERLVEWELMKQSRQDYLLAPTKSTENLSNINPLQKQLGNHNKKVNVQVNKREEVENMNFKPNSCDDEVVYEDNCYYKSHYQPIDLMFQTKSIFGDYKKTKGKKEKISGLVEIEKSKVAKQKSTIFKPACSNKFKCPKFLLYAIINVNTTNNDTVAVSLRGIEKNKKKKVIDLYELESAVCDLQEILQDDSPQDHALPENMTGKVKKPKTKEQIAARKLRKQMRKQKGMMQ